jgi:hypothetical protein
MSDRLVGVHGLKLALHEIPPFSFSRREPLRVVLR